MKFMLIIFSCWLIGFTASPADAVYICKSKTATKYHYTSSCRGLNACKSEIVKISLSDAKEMGRKLCGWED